VVGRSEQDGEAVSHPFATLSAQHAAAFAGNQAALDVLEKASNASLPIAHPHDASMVLAARELLAFAPTRHTAATPAIEPLSPALPTAKPRAESSGWSSAEVLVPGTSGVLADGCDLPEVSGAEVSADPAGFYGTYVLRRQAVIVRGALDAPELAPYRALWRRKTLLRRYVTPARLTQCTGTRTGHCAFLCTLLAERARILLMAAHYVYVCAEGTAAHDGT
jgi:hypothetical protein